MAESEVKRAGIGINVAIDGLDGLTKVNELVDRLHEKVKPLTENINQMRDAFNHFGGTDNLAKAGSSVDKLSNGLNEARKATQTVNITINDMHKSLSGIYDAGKKAQDGLNFSSTVNKSNKLVNELQDNLGRLNSNGVGKVKGEFHGIDEAVTSASKSMKEFSGKTNQSVEKASAETRKLGDTLKSTGDEAHKSGHRIRDIVAGSFIANSVINSWYSLKSAIGGALKAGEEYDKEQQVMHATWDTLTGDAKKAKRWLRPLIKSQFNLVNQRI
ncbi:hypothetical protein [Lentilactobacillus kosonis]|uniref:Phage tail length tape-measure protein n=1 Tax=Lentilactobacillus kosonis TaxID=2810561 RepID=A0A401FPJ6_9LACO|nr:hypothetical protein [Lentilactobacillus kosonis]GAY74284.1 phage tail length tape-measure protein [Lentilactobacillus kosonis]